MGEDTVHDRLVLAFTPGIPLEWVYAALNLNQAKRKALRDMIDAVDRVEFEKLGGANADTIVAGDGMKMIEAVVPGYSGAAPIWAAIELNQLDMIDAAVGKILGVSRRRVWQWRNTAIFCPLTLKRLTANRGTSLL